MTTRDSTRRKRWLLLLVAPVLLSGCAMFTASKGGLGNDDAGDAAAAAEGDNWLVVAQGSATPSPTPSRGVSPAPTATGGFLPLSPPIRPAPTSTCARDTPHFNKINALTVVTGRTSGTVRWYNVGGYNLVEFRITAISQDLKFGKQRDVGWVTVKPGKPCGFMTATVPKLDRKTGYVFSVDAVVVRRSGEGTHAATIFRSSAVYTK